jgi:hypothetical protein
MNWYRIAQQSPYYQRWGKDDEGFTEDAYTQVGHSEESISWMWDGQNFQSFKGKSHLYYPNVLADDFRGKIWRGWYDGETQVVSVTPPGKKVQQFQGFIGKDIKIPPVLERMLTRKFNPVDIKVFV